MEDNPVEPANATPKVTPTQLLYDQTQQLRKLVHQQQEMLVELGRLNNQNDSAEKPVIIVDFNMPFLSLVGILVKIALASIPASVIFGIVAMIFLAVLSACGLSILG